MYMFITQPWKIHSYQTRSPQSEQLLDTLVNFLREIK